MSTPETDPHTELLKSIAASLKGIHTSLEHLTGAVEGVAESIEKAHEPEGDLGVHLVGARRISPRHFTNARSRNVASSPSWYKTVRIRIRGVATSAINSVLLAKRNALLVRISKILMTKSLSVMIAVAIGSLLSNPRSPHTKNSLPPQPYIRIGETNPLRLRKNPSSPSPVVRTAADVAGAMDAVASPPRTNRVRISRTGVITVYWI